MSRHVKNWTKFQHFKDRRPPWIKLYRDLLDDPDWHELDGDDAKSLVMIWLIASEDGGILPDARKLAFRLRTTESKALQLLNRLSHWLGQDDITMISEEYHTDAPETETETETQVKAEGESSSVASAPRRSDENWFEEFWATYPKRHGTNSRKDACAKFKKLIKRGVDPAEIIRGTRGYAAEMADKIGTEFIKQAISFLNAELWADYLPKAPIIANEIPLPPAPGMRTDEEIRADVERRKAASVTASRPEILESGGGIYHEEQDGLGGSEAGYAGVRRLGEILPNAGLEAFRGQEIRAAGNYDDDDASPLA